jgi:hypothetical protein
MSRTTACILTAVLMASAGTAFAQSLPTTQPNYLLIYREQVKVGHVTDHEKVEAGWPAAYDKAKDPYTYIALVSMTGRGEAWFVTPFESQAAIGDALKREDEPMLASTLQRLSKADADQINSMEAVLAMGRKDLSHGPYPDTGKQRFYDITVFHVKPGHQAGFEAAAKAYAAAADRAVPAMSFRVYQVMAGMPSPTYLVFSSVTSYAAFDKAMADGQALMKAMTPEERETMAKFSSDGLVSSEMIRFRLDPAMSYVTQEVRAEDPAFWMPKPAMTTASAKPVPKTESKR